MAEGIGDIGGDLTEVTDLRERVREFLYREAAVLDRHRRREWLDLLTDDIEYRIPVSVNKEIDEEADFVGDGYFFEEDLPSLEARVRRFETEYAWSEKPASRTRRMISNVRIRETEPDEVSISYNFVIFRYRGERTQPEIVSGVRHDRLRLVDGELKLAKRDAELDQTILDLSPMSIFL